MKTVIIIHGSPDKEEFLSGKHPTKQHWIPWLRERLTEQGMTVHVPEMPVPYEPVYEAWTEILEQYKITKDTILIGHSSGGGFILRWLSEHPEEEVGKVILVAPWLDPAQELKTGFLNFVPNIKEYIRIDILYSADDTMDVLESVTQLKTSIPHATYIEFQNKGHFSFDDLKTEEFPELLNLIKV